MIKIITFKTYFLITNDKFVLPHNNIHFDHGHNLYRKDLFILLSRFKIYHNICVVFKVYIWPKWLFMSKDFLSSLKTSRRGEMWHSSNNTWTCSYPYEHESHFLWGIDHNNCSCSRNFYWTLIVILQHYVIHLNIL